MEDKYSISSKILHRTRLLTNKIDDIWTKFVNVKMSRDTANQLRKHIVSAKGRSVVDGTLLKRIKEYSYHTFGSDSYWPWLACYTEMRGEFKEGWLPDDYYRFELLPEINPDKYMKFSEAKIIDHKLFGNSIIEPLFFRTIGLYYDKNGKPLSQPEVEDILSGLNQEIIIKPDNGHGGNSIMFKHSSEINLDDLPVGSNLLFQKVVKQHSELNALYPHSINTFRVLSYLNQAGEVDIKFMIIRFGRDGARIDNASNGGGWIFIHDNGRPDPMGCNKYGLPLDGKHPDTGAVFADLQLPYYPKIVEFCKKAHRNFPYASIIGWDVYINENGDPKLIEWNANNPFWGHIEAHFGPFLKELITPKPSQLVMEDEYEIPA